MNFRASGLGDVGFKFSLPIVVFCFALLTGLGYGVPDADGSTFGPGASTKKDRLIRKSGVFRVNVKGVQLNRWSKDTSPRSECDVWSRGSGFERVRFHTPVRRMRVVAFGSKRANTAIFKSLPVRGKVTRKGKLNHGSSESLPEHCFADGGGDPPPPPPARDCGTKAIRNGKLAPFALNGKLSLDLTRTNHTSPLFRNCDWVGRVWPSLLTRRQNGSVITTDFSPRWVYNPRFNRRTGAWSKVIMIARGTNIVRGFGTWYKTSVRWTITMKRLR